MPPINAIKRSECVEKADAEIQWVLRENDYKTSSFISNYGDVKQRWLLIYSEQAYKREKKTFEKNPATIMLDNIKTPTETLINR